MSLSGDVRTLLQFAKTLVTTAIEDLVEPNESCEPRSIVTLKTVLQATSGYSLSSKDCLAGITTSMLNLLVAIMIQGFDDSSFSIAQAHTAYQTYCHQLNLREMTMQEVGEHVNNLRDCLVLCDAGKKKAGTSVSSKITYLFLLLVDCCCSADIVWQ
jgi:Cdc6-like AAA superfamily ATPase